ESTLTPTYDGRDYLYRDGDHYQTLRNVARFSPRDADAYDEYARYMYFMAKAVRYILNIIPPDPTTLSPRDMMALLDMARHFLNLSQDQLYVLAKLMTMSAADFVEQWFESEPLKATLSASGIIGTFLGPRSPGTAYVLLHHYMGEIDGAYRAWGFHKGGTGALSNAIAAAARGFGVEIVTEAPVERVRMSDGRATGVVLKNGDEIGAKVVVSGVDPHRTFFGLVGEDALPSEFVQQLQRYKLRGSSGKVNLAVDRLPNFTCRPGAGPHLEGDIAIAPSIEYLERAYDEAKYG